jgi:Xaa-Pro aminopeptidase
MDACGLDGLASLVPINVYYLTDFWSEIMQAGFDASQAAVLPRHPDGPLMLVCPALDLRNVINAGPSVDDIVTYTSAGEGGEAIPYRSWLTREGVPLTDRQKLWISETARLTANPVANAVKGLVVAIERAGLSHGTIGVDDERLLQWLPEAGLTKARLVPARDSFNEIRLVKTEDEIELLRTAARINESAMMHCMGIIEEGMPWTEIEREYRTEMARQDGEAVYIQCAVGGMQHGKVTRGEPIMFDALGRYRHYHGDFGRSAVVGEPGPDVRERVRALEAGIEAAFAVIRPGQRYSDVIEQASTAIRKAGFPGQFRPPVLHCLGLHHTDDPGHPWGPSWAKPGDRVLEVDMVLNVDLPHVEIGWGAVHLEDTIRITKDGCERLTSEHTALRVIDA